MNFLKRDTVESVPSSGKYRDGYGELWKFQAITLGIDQAEKNKRGGNDFIYKRIFGGQARVNLSHASILGPSSIKGHGGSGNCGRASLSVKCQETV